MVSLDATNDNNSDWFSNGGKNQVGVENRIIAWQPRFEGKVSKNGQ